VSTESKINGDPSRYVVPFKSNKIIYEELSIKWWQWALSIPIPKNPILDTTGENGGIGQSGGVWFLAGTKGTTGVKRTVDIPANKFIFIPIFKIISFPYPTFETNDQLKGDVKGYIDQVKVHNVELDGKNLDNFRVDSRIFIFTVPKNNYLNLDYPDLPARSYRAASDGYWIMLKPLPVGKHTIVINGNIDESLKNQVTYTINIKPERR